MLGYIEQRVLDEAGYIVEHEATVRNAAKKFGISKSTVHHDMRKRLMSLDPALAREVSAVLGKNKSERHIRGGRATYLKYRGETAEEQA